MGAYTNTGPFNSGGSPGISAAFLNNIETFIQQQQGNTNTVVVNGGSSGTATCYQSLQGTYKQTLIQLNNFRTGGAAQNMTLPVAYTYGAAFFVSDTEHFALQSGGVDQPCVLLTGFTNVTSGTANGGVITASVTTLMSWLSGDLHSGFNVVQFRASWSGAHGGFIILMGV